MPGRTRSRQDLSIRHVPANQEPLLRRSVTTSHTMVNFTRSDSSRSHQQDANPGIDLSTLQEPAPGMVDEGLDTDDDDEVGASHKNEVSYRLTAVCTCEQFDKEKLPELLSSRLGGSFRWRHGQETIYVPFSPQLLQDQRQNAPATFQVSDSGTESGLREPMLPKEPCDDLGRCMIFFQYGVVVMWGLVPAEEQELLSSVVEQVALHPLKKELVEKEMLHVHYHDSQLASVRDDTVRLPMRLRGHVGAMLSIAHALAQSTKLCVFEGQGTRLVQSTAHLPKELAERGRISLSERSLSRLIGQLFVHKNEVNLLSSVLDTPEYFWHAPDSLQELYKAAGNYLEMEERIEAVNARFEVTKEMLDMMQSRYDTKHGAFLEWVVIILVAIEGIIGVLEFCGTIGLIAPVSRHYSLASRIYHTLGGGHEGT